MASSDVINLILQEWANAFNYMLPIIAVMAAINFLIGFLIWSLFGVERESFGRY